MVSSSDMGSRELYFRALTDDFEDLDLDEADIDLDADTDSSEDEAVFDDRCESLRTYTAKQRIEIAREMKWLDSALSDHFDY